MEINYKSFKETRRKEIDAIKTKYMRGKIIPPKRSDIKPLFCIVWQAGRLNQNETDNTSVVTISSESDEILAKKEEIEVAFDESLKNAFNRNIIIGYVFCNQDAMRQNQEYIFHYSKSGVEKARQMDEENAQNGTVSNSFFNSFLYRKLFTDIDGMYISNGGIFPVFKEKLMALKNRREEILEESTKTGKSVLQVSTSDISNDFILIGAKEPDIERYYRELIKSYYSSKLLIEGINLEIEDVDLKSQKRRAEKELKNNTTDLVY